MYLGIDLGGSHVKYGLIKNKVIQNSSMFPIAGMSFTEILATTALEIHKMLAEAGITKSDLDGLSMALPGVVSSSRSELIAVNKKYEDAVGFDFLAWSEASFGLPIQIFNDAKMALMGEVFAGVGQGKTDVSMVIIGTGIGTAVMMGHKILKSRNHCAGNMGGHFIVHTDGEMCTCGCLGCVEAYASNSILHERVTNNWDLSNSSLAKVGKIDYRAIFDRFYTDEVAKEIGEKLISYWGALVVNMLHAYDSEQVILSGGVFNSPVDVRSRIMEYVEDNVWLPRGSYSLDVAENPSFSVLLGAESKKENYYRWDS